MQVNGADTAVLGVDPSQFRSFAARPTGAADALWQGVATAASPSPTRWASWTRSRSAARSRPPGATAKRLPVVAFGTLGIGGVNAVVSDATARALGAPAGNAIVVSVRTGDFTADAAAIGRLLPKGAGVEPLVSLVNSPAARAPTAGAAGDGAADRGGLPRPSSAPCSGPR